MTEKQIEKMKKYVELIRRASWKDAMYYMSASQRETRKLTESDLDKSERYIAIADYLILRMEREMKR